MVMIRMVVMVKELIMWWLCNDYVNGNGSDDYHDIDGDHFVYDLINNDSDD